MFAFIRHQRGKFLFSAVSRLLVFVLSFSLVFGPSVAQAQTIASLNLPVPGAMVGPSQAFVPILLKGMTIHPDNPLQFDFIIDSGNTNFTQNQIKDESQRLVKYFLASMTIPKDDLWVNLSPHESDKIIPKELGRTELGRDMLAQDYILKQLTASLMYPEKELGKAFWDKVYKQAKEKYGTTKIPVDTFNKVWILPETATVYEHGQTVYIVEAKLKVMLDSDYVAMTDSRKSSVVSRKQESLTTYDLPLTTQIVKEIILPEIEREVNQGQNFAPLRQIYHSLILAKWYKETIKNSLLSKIYVDQKKIAGVNLDDATLKDQIYAQYMEAYKKGVFNYIKEDYDRLSNETIPRKYFSGGEMFTNFELITLDKTSNSEEVTTAKVGQQSLLTTRVNPQKEDSSSPVPEMGEGGMIGRWKYESVTLADDGTLTLHNAIRIPRKDGVVESEFLIDGQNTARNIVLETRELNKKEQQKIAGIITDLGLETGPPIRVIERTESSVAQRIYGVAASNMIFISVGILQLGKYDQIKEAIDHERRELSTKKHDEIRAVQFQGNLTALLKKLTAIDKNTLLALQQAYKELGTIKINEEDRKELFAQIDLLSQTIGYQETPFIKGVKARESENYDKAIEYFTQAIEGGELRGVTFLAGVYDDMGWEATAFKTLVEYSIKYPELQNDPNVVFFLQKLASKNMRFGKDTRHEGVATVILGLERAEVPDFIIEGMKENKIDFTENPKATYVISKPGQANAKPPVPSYIINQYGFLEQLDYMETKVVMQILLSSGGTMRRWKYESVTLADDGKLTLHRATRIPGKDYVVKEELFSKDKNEPRDIVLQTRKLNTAEIKKIEGIKQELRMKEGIGVFERDEAAVRNRIYGAAAVGIVFVREDIFDKGTREQIKEAIDHERMELTSAKYDEKGSLWNFITELSNEDKMDRKVTSSDSSAQSSSPVATDAYKGFYDRIRVNAEKLNIITDEDLKRSRRFLGRNAELLPIGERQKNETFGIAEVHFLSDSQTRQRMVEFQQQLINKFGKKLYLVDAEKLHFTIQGFERQWKDESRKETKPFATHTGLNTIDPGEGDIAQIRQKARMINTPTVKMQVSGINWDPGIGIFWELRPYLIDPSSDPMAQRKAAWDLPQARPPHITAAYFTQEFSAEDLVQLRQLISQYQSPDYFGDILVDKLHDIAYTDLSFNDGYRVLEEITLMSEDQTVADKAAQANSRLLAQVKNLLAKLNGTTGLLFIEKMTTDVGTAREVIQLRNQLAESVRQGNKDTEAALRELTDAILAKLREKAETDNLKRLAKDIPAFNRTRTLPHQKAHKIMMITGGTAVGTLWANVLNHQMEQYIDATGIVGNSDDGGSSYEIVSALNKAGYGIIPPPGDQVNALQGLLNADKRTYLMGNNGRLDKKNPPPNMLEGALEAVRKTLLDARASEDGKTIDLGEDFIYFSRVLLSAVKSVDRINAEIQGRQNPGIAPLETAGASIRNLLLLGFLKEYGAIGSAGTKKANVSAIDSSNQGIYEEAVKDMARASGVNGNYVSVLSFQPHTLYGVYNGYTMLFKNPELGTIEALGIEEHKGEQSNEVHLTAPSAMRSGGQKSILKDGEEIKLPQLLASLPSTPEDISFKNKEGKIIVTIDGRQWNVVEEDGVNITKLVSLDKSEEIEIAADGTGRRKIYEGRKDATPIFKIATQVEGASIDIFFRSRLVKTQTNLTETVNFLELQEFGLLEGLGINGQQPQKQYGVKIAPNQKIIDEIKSAKKGDLIVIGPGSFYTSILPHFLVNGFPNALIAAKKGGVHVVLVLNGTKDNETVHKQPIDMLKELNKAVASEGVSVADIFSFIIGGTYAENGARVENEAELIQAIGSTYGLAMEIRTDPGKASEQAKLSRGALMLDDGQIREFQALGINAQQVITMPDALYIREEKGREKNATAHARALYAEGKIREAILKTINSTSSPVTVFSKDIDAVTQTDLSEEKQKRVAVRLEQPGGIEPYPSTIRLMRDLNVQGIKVGVGTSSSNAGTVLARLNAQDAFDVLLDGRIAKNDNIPSKPHREFYLEAARRLGVEPGKTVVVEDAVSGVESAVNGKFGLIIGLARENDTEALQNAGADIVLNDIADLTVHEINVRLAEKLGEDLGQKVLQGVIFDMDGVISDTTHAHFQSWRETFGEYLQKREEAFGEPFSEFNFDEYKRYVSGRTRKEAVRAFLESRGISIPEGDTSSPISREEIIDVVASELNTSSDEMEYVLMSLAEEILEEKNTDKRISISKRNILNIILRNMHLSPSEAYNLIIEHFGPPGTKEASSGPTEQSNSPMSSDDDKLGGIDMNKIDLEREGAGVDIQFDPAELQEIIDAGIDGFAPVIINITPLPSVLPLLGLQPAKEEEALEVSRLN